MQTTTVTAWEKTKYVHMKILEKEQSELFRDADVEKDTLDMRNTKTVKVVVHAQPIPIIVFSVSHGLLCLVFTIVRES